MAWRNVSFMLLMATVHEAPTSEIPARVLRDNHQLQSREALSVVALPDAPTAARLPTEELEHDCNFSLRGVVKGARLHDSFVMVRGDDKTVTVSFSGWTKVGDESVRLVDLGTRFATFRRERDDLVCRKSVQ